MHQDGEVEEEAFLLKVVEVVLETLMDGEFAIGAELPEAGHSLWDEQPLMFDGGVVLNDERHLRTRTDERHISQQNVDELRQLIKAGLAQESASGGDARIERGLRRRAVARRRDVHAAELEDAKGSTLLRDTLLTEEDGSWRGELDPDGDQDPDWCCEKQEKGRDGDVKQAFGSDVDEILFFRDDQGGDVKAIEEANAGGLLLLGDALVADERDGHAVILREGQDFREAAFLD